MSEYPSWRRVNATEIYSAEERDGTPDFLIVQDVKTKRWHVKWRTSAHWSDQTFETASKAMRHVERARQS